MRNLPDLMQTPLREVLDFFGGSFRVTTAVWSSLDDHLTDWYYDPEPSVECYLNGYKVSLGDSTLGELWDSDERFWDVFYLHFGPFEWDDMYHTSDGWEVHSLSIDSVSSRVTLTYTNCESDSLESRSLPLTPDLLDLPLDCLYQRNLFQDIEAVPAKAIPDETFLPGSSNPYGLDL